MVRELRVFKFLATEFARHHPVIAGVNMLFVGEVIDLLIAEAALQQQIFEKLLRFCVKLVCHN